MCGTLCGLGVALRFVRGLCGCALQVTVVWLCVCVTICVEMDIACAMLCVPLGGWLQSSGCWVCAPLGGDSCRGCMRPCGTL